MQDCCSSWTKWSFEAFGKLRALLFGDCGFAAPKDKAPAIVYATDMHLLSPELAGGGADMTALDFSKSE